MQLIWLNVYVRWMLRSWNLVFLLIHSYITLCQGFRDLRNAYSMILDKIEKNYEKLTNPKGVAAHMQHELLYQFPFVVYCFLYHLCMWSNHPSTLKGTNYLDSVSLQEKQIRFWVITIQLFFMDQDKKVQYAIISKKNWIVIKRNPAELVVDIMQDLIHYLKQIPSFYAVYSCCYQSQCC